MFPKIEGAETPFGPSEEVWATSETHIGMRGTFTINRVDYRVRLDDRLLDVHAGKRADRVHGLPSRQHQKLDLVTELAASELCARKARDMAQLGDDLLAEMLRVRARLR